MFRQREHFAHKNTTCHRIHTVSLAVPAQPVHMWHCCHRSKEEFKELKKNGTIFLSSTLKKRQEHFSLSKLRATSIGSYKTRFVPSWPTVACSWAENVLIRQLKLLKVFAFAPPLPCFNLVRKPVSKFLVGFSIKHSQCSHGVLRRAMECSDGVGMPLKNLSCARTNLAYCRTPFRITAVLAEGNEHASLQN